MALIIASVLARSREQVVRHAKRAAMLGADWLELRLDIWPLQEDLAPVIDEIGLPVLVACRTPEDGGQYRGTLTARRTAVMARVRRRTIAATCAATSSSRPLSLRTYCE